MSIKNIPDPLVVLVSEYVRPSHLYVLRDVCKDIRNVLDKKNPLWERILSHNIAPKRILYKNSIGTTALLVKSSWKQAFCLNCERTTMLHINYYYGIFLCYDCEKNNKAFFEVNLKAICFDYFLDYKTQKENANLIKVRNGRAFKVLHKHILKVAHLQYPDGELQDKINRRYYRNRETAIRRYRSRERRTASIKTSFGYLVGSNISRIDPILTDIISLTNVVNMFGCREKIFGDVYSLKITTRYTVSEVCNNLCDYSMMITYMKKKGFLDEQYHVNFFAVGTTPFYVYSKHRLPSGLHFYELVNEYVDSVNETEKRSAQVERYLLTEKTTRQRKSLAIAMCVEDGIDYNQEDFQDFVESGLGNPVYIARKRRARVFLNRNGFMDYMDRFLQAGYDVHEASNVATKLVLDRTKGYPPMMRVCNINLGG